MLIFCWLFVRLLSEPDLSDSSKSAVLWRECRDKLVAYHTEQLAKYDPEFELQLNLRDMELASFGAGNPGTGPVSALWRQLEGDHVAQQTLVGLLDKVHNKTHSREGWPAGFVSRSCQIPE